MQKTSDQNSPAAKVVPLKPAQPRQNPPQSSSHEQEWRRQMIEKELELARAMRANGD